MQNVLKRKNMYLEEFQVILIFFPLTPYVLEHYVPNDLHVKK